MKEETVPATATHIRAIPSIRPPDDLAILFREHHEHIFRAAYRVTGSTADAEDVLQTVFLRLVKRRGLIDPETHTRSYLTRAAVNAALDLLRARGRANAVSLEDVAAVLAETRDRGPAAQHEEREMRRVVQQAVARLGETAAEMFVLRYFEGFDNREIAQMLNTSQMVVAVTLHRSRRRMRKEIGEFLEKHHEAH